MCIRDRDKLTLREGWQNMSSLYIQEKTEYCYTSRSTYLSLIHIYQMPFSSDGDEETRLPSGM